MKKLLVSLILFVMLFSSLNVFSVQAESEYTTKISGDIELNFNDDWQPMFKYGFQHMLIPPDIYYIQVYAVVHIKGKTDAQSLSIESAEFPSLTEKIEIDDNGNFDKEVEVILTSFNSIEPDTINFSAYITAHKGDKTLRTKIGKGQLKTDFLINAKDNLDQDNDGTINSLDFALFKSKYYDAFKAEYDKIGEQENIDTYIYNEWYMTEFEQGKDGISFNADNHIKANTDATEVILEITDSNNTEKYEYKSGELDIINKFSGLLPTGQSSSAARSSLKAYNGNREIELRSFLKVRTSEAAIIGDLNGDKSVNSVDFAILRKYLLGQINNFPVESGFFSADIDDDTLISAADFAYLRQYLLDMRVSFPKYSTNLSDLSPEELLGKPEQISIDGSIYSIKTFLWRDFMPACPPNGQPLLGQIDLIGDANVKLPETIDLDRVWIINGNKVWESDFSKENRPISNNSKTKMEKVVRDGPKWGPGINVDVVVRIVDKADDKVYFLRAASQRISRTD